MKKLLISIVWLLPCGAAGQSIYGLSGLVKTPSAYVLDTGAAQVQGCYVQDYMPLSEDHFEQWATSVGLGLHSRLEASVRLTYIPEIPAYEELPTDQTFDRSLNVKLVLLRERRGKHWPQLAVGGQDLVGASQFFHGVFAVLSRSIEVAERYKVQGHAGYGVRWLEQISAEVSGHRFDGFFTGVQATFWNTLSFTAEYDSQDFNLGLRASYRKHVAAQLYLLNLRWPAAGIAFQINI